MSENLQDLFIQYQIPSDLLSYAGKPCAPVEEKIRVVKAQVAAMFEMIKKSKEREIEEQNKIREYEGRQRAERELERSSVLESSVRRKSSA